MSMYKYKEIQTVPPAPAFIDIVLSKTQRKTPTVVHPGYKLSRIRKFYLRKIKYAQSTFSEKIAQILSDFPRIDDIHPFYADLCNVLYDRDHYKLALGQLNTSKNVVDGVAKDYARMMNFSDSLYRCKMLKRAALGRMCTCIKKMDAPLKYLEEVRQHLARLPSINPQTRTLILTGYPNVGKSSFINTVSQANVDVQPYAFTTKSLFVGHMDYKYSRWQVIDTPGILDHPLEDRNTIEMTAITALAHIPATILFFIDISETCGFYIHQQASLFNSLKPLFKNKPLMIVMNKTDLKQFEELEDSQKDLINKMCEECEELNYGRKIELMRTSCATKEGIDVVKNKACDLLLEQRVEKRLQGTKVEALKNRIHVAEPKAVSKSRVASVPESVLKARAAAAANPGKALKVKKANEKKANSGLKRKDRMDTESNVDGTTNASTMGDNDSDMESDDEDVSEIDTDLDSDDDVLDADGTKKILTERDLQEELGGAGVYSTDFRKKFILAKEEWKYDEAPEIMDGVNVADFIDEDILAKMAELEELEAKELERECLGLDADNQEMDSWNETEGKLKQAHLAIKYKRTENMDRKARNTMGHGGTERKQGKKLEDVKSKLMETRHVKKSMDKALKDGGEKKRKQKEDELYENMRGRSRVRAGLDESLEKEGKKGKSGMDVDAGGMMGNKNSKHLSRNRDKSTIRGYSVHRDASRSRIAEGMQRLDVQEKAEKLRRKKQRGLSKDRVKSRAGEADRHVPDFKPKHLHCGKRGMGKTDRR